MPIHKDQSSRLTAVACTSCVHEVYLFVCQINANNVIITCHNDSHRLFHCVKVIHMAVDDC